MNTFLYSAKKIEAELIEIRRDLHMHPELGFQEFRTSKLIKDFLTKEKIAFREVAGTGVCASIKGEAKGQGKVIALRADMDALPILDKKNCQYKSLNEGKMHACGHDSHTTILLGVAKILNSIKKDFSGEVRLLFEPAEETTGGAPIMIKEGVLENPRVDIIVGLHVNEEVECGKIIVKSDVCNAASNPFTIKVKGSGGHGAHPESTVDPIIAASNIVMGAQTIISRELSAFSPAVITFGTINGGTAQNIIPDEVKLTGIIRTMSKEDRIYCEYRLREFIQNICKSFRAEAEIDIEEGYPCLYNNEAVVKRVKNSAITVLGEENVLPQRNSSLGVESFAYFAKERPSAFYFLGTKSNKVNTDKPAHSSLFDIDEDAIILGVAIQCDIAYEYLTSS